MASHQKSPLRPLGLSAVAPLLTAFLIGTAGCRSTPDERLQRPLPARTASRPHAVPAQPERVGFLLVNPKDQSGWIAYDCGDDEDAEGTVYHITVTREDSGQLLYESRVTLSATLCEDGFEMDAGDPRLQEMLSSADRNLVTPLLQMRRTQSQPGETSPPDGLAPASQEAPAISDDPHLSILEVHEDHLIFEAPGAPPPLGQRFFLRTQPETMLNPATGAETLVSRGRVAGLVEVTRIDGQRITATLRGGDLIENGILEMTD